MIRRLMARVQQYVQSQRDARLSPECLQGGDTFIVEFPKSGVTWLSMLIANSFANEFGLGERVTFGSVRRFVPDLHASRAVAPRLSPGGVGFYKSHAHFNRNYVTTVYLVRHPLAVMSSYHKFRATLDPTTPSDFDAFLNDQHFGLAAWRRHICSWLLIPRDSSQRQLHLVRYEDLQVDAGLVLNELAANLGWDLSKAAIAEAVSQSTRDEMRMQEDLYRHHNPAHRLDFVSEASAVVPNSAAIDYVARICSSELAMLGYSEDER